MTRRSRFLTVLLSLMALLLSGAALASYACPEHAKAWEVARMTEAGAPCAETMSRAMDDEEPALCQAHCQTSGCSADSFHPPAIGSAVDFGIVRVLWLASQSLAPPEPVSAGLLERDSGPPLAIRHCCLRT